MYMAFARLTLRYEIWLDDLNRRFVDWIGFCSYGTSVFMELLLGPLEVY